MADKRSGSAKRSQSDKKTSNPVARYLRETRGELKKVTWPTRDESQRLTVIVLGVTVAMAVFLWVFDLLFSNAVSGLLNLLIGT